MLNFGLTGQVLIVGLYSIPITYISYDVFLIKY